ncbi:uncharacterized protein [Centruroides vittatus]|uniref:uncharacterized protein n=1 Tax=Centruroides vittatus TaxID=120091 RepID=UPI00350F0244
MVATLNEEDYEENVKEKKNDKQDKHEEEGRIRFKKRIRQNECKEEEEDDDDKDLEKRKQETITAGNIEELKQDPTENIRKILKKNLKNLLKEGIISTSESKELLPKENVITNSAFSVKNADILISKLEAGRILPEYKLMSLDIETMYPSITKEIIIQSLINGKYYRQKDGISMGSVVGSKLAEIVMIDIDKILSTINGIVFLERYVDDILLIYNSKVTFPEKIVEEANKINKCIRFTHESEKFN